MARRNTSKKENFKEFSFDGKEIKYSGRIYPDSTQSSKKVDYTAMTLTLNGVITIKGCKLMQSDKNTWISFPQWKDKNDEYQSYVYVDKEFSQAELDKVAEAAEKALSDD